MYEAIQEGVGKALSWLLTPDWQQVATALIVLGLSLKGAWKVSALTGGTAKRAWRWLTAETPPEPPAPLGKVASAVLAALASNPGVRAMSRPGEYEVASAGVKATVVDGCLTRLEIHAGEWKDCYKHLSATEAQSVRKIAALAVEEYEAREKKAEEDLLAGAAVGAPTKGYVPTLPLPAAKRTTA